jgi:DNA-binding HxlR family transcriptional regulator
VGFFSPSVNQMSTPLTLNNELRKLVESRLEQTLKGIEDTLKQIIEKQKLTPEELKTHLESFQESFNILFQKWNLEILYTIFLKGSIGFGELKKILTADSRTLSDKLKILKRHDYILRDASEGPPLRVEYTLTVLGKNTVLLALPLLYYSRPC